MATTDHGGRSGNGTFASAGRTGPVRAIVATIAAAGLLRLTGIAFDRGGMPAYVLAGGIAGLTLAKLCARWARRLHDTGQSGWVGVATGAVAAVVLTVLTVSSLRDTVPWSVTAAWIVIGAAAAFLLLRPGTPGDNRFGPPPATALATGTAPAGQGGMVWALVAALGGGLIGYALIDISEGMRDARQRTRQAIEQDGTR